MTHLQILPDELLVRVISSLDKNGLAQTRLVNKRLGQIAVEKLFERVTLYAHWKKGRDDDEESRHSVESGLWNYGVYYQTAHEGTDGQDDEERDRDVCRTIDDLINVSEEEEASQTLHFEEREVRDLGPLSDRSDSESMCNKQELYEDWGGNHREHREQLLRRMPEWAIDRLPGPADYNARAFRNILQHPVLKNYVKELQIYTCEPHCDHHPSLAAKWFDGAWPSPSYDPIYRDCIKRLREFSNVRAIAVHFDRHGGEDGYNDIFQGEGFQQKWLRRVLQPLNNRITEIAIRHYDHLLAREWEASGLSLIVIKATSLRMSMKHGETHPDSGPTYRVGFIHPFWEKFSDQFLKPPASHLRTLVLYSDLPLGWFPKLDLRTVHFPTLHSLTLGHHIFHHNHQIDWIISHAATLQELYLDRCSILYHIGHTIPGWLDDDGYPKAKPPNHVHFFYGWSETPGDLADDEEFSRKLHFKSINIRWHDIFSRFVIALEQLHTFRFGSSTQWKFDTRSRFHEYPGNRGAMPIMPWEDEMNIEIRILEERYVIWDDWMMQYRPHWTTETDMFEKTEQEGWRNEWIARFEAYPDCREEDEAALQALLVKIGML